jgi:hypothetical protein
MLALLLLSMMPGAQSASPSAPASAYAAAPTETRPSAASAAPPDASPLDAAARLPAARYGQQGKLERAIEDAYVGAHRPTAEDVTTAMDGTDRITRIRTPYGANLCLNWRDVDRFNPGKRKTVFVTACNR